MPDDASTAAPCAQECVPALATAGTVPAAAAAAAARGPLGVLRASVLRHQLSNGKPTNLQRIPPASLLALCWFPRVGHPTIKMLMAPSMGLFDGASRLPSTRICALPAF